MLSSFRLVQKCLAVNLPMKITAANLRTTQNLRVDNKDKKLGDVEIVDIDVENMFTEDDETAYFFRLPCEPKETGLLDMYGNPMLEKLPEPTVLKRDDIKKEVPKLPAIEEIAPLPVLEEDK